MEEFYDNQRYTRTHNLIRWKSGKRVDPKLLGVLELFGEVYIERPEFFKKIFDEKYEELFEKIGNALKKRKKMKEGRSMGRSMSMRAIGERGMEQEIEKLNLERLRITSSNVIEVHSFKIKTPNVIDESRRLARFKIRAPNVIEEGRDGPIQGGPMTTTQGS